MASNAVCGLSACEVHSDGDDLLRLDFKVDGVGHCECAIWYANTILASKCYFLDGLGLNLVDASGLVQRKRDCHSGDGKIGTAKDVGEFETDLLGRSGHVQSLSNCRVHEDCACLVLYDVLIHTR